MKKLLAIFLLLPLYFGCDDATSPFRSCPDFDIQGHRGARGYLPENSIPGFVLALEQGATTLEMDIVVSKDAEVVVSHEPWMNNVICTDAQGNEFDEGDVINLYAMSMDEIRSFDCGTKANPAFPTQQRMAVSKPALWEVISVTERLRTKGDSALPHYNIEIKFKDEWVDRFHPNAQQFASLLIGELRQLGISDRTCVQSFSKDALEAVHSIAPELCTTWLIEEEIDFEENAFDLSFIPSIISPHYESLTSENVEFAHDAGAKVIPWTVNEQAEMSKLIQIGVDGIITDFPDLLYDEVQKRKQS